MSIIRRMMLTTSMLCKPFQVTIDNENVLNCNHQKILSRSRGGILLKRCCPGHGEEYYYEDDGTWTSLCLALPPPQPSVRLLKTHFVLPLFRADPTFNIQGEIAAVFEGWSPCNTTCQTTGQFCQILQNTLKTKTYTDFFLV